MKVYINKRCGGYSGGIIIVAADSAEEAHKVFHNDYTFSYMHTRCEDGSELDFYYYPENWKEVPLLTYNSNSPCVIDENGYTG